MPGASVSPRASTRWRAGPSSVPTATMRPRLTATPPARGGPPRPSITDALSITRSCTSGSSESAAVVGPGGLDVAQRVLLAVGAGAAERRRERDHPRVVGDGHEIGEGCEVARGSAVHDEAAVHAEGLTGHVARAIRREE